MTNSFLFDLPLSLTLFTADLDGVPDRPGDLGTTTPRKDRDEGDFDRAQPSPREDRDGDLDRARSRGLAGDFDLARERAVREDERASNCGVVGDDGALMLIGRRRLPLSRLPLW